MILPSQCFYPTDTIMIMDLLGPVTDVKSHVF